MADANMFATAAGSGKKRDSEGFQTFEHEEVDTGQRYGRVSLPRKGAYPFDIVRGASAPVPFTVTSNREMPRDAAEKALGTVLERFGVEREKEEFLMSFCDALWVCHTLNSASVQTPGRAEMRVDGARFQYWEVIDQLGVDARRFFRAYADDIRGVNKRVLDQGHVDDPGIQDMRNGILWVARERGLSRAPELAHDSADACTGLSVGDYELLKLAKASLLSKTPNVADYVSVLRGSGGDGDESFQRSMSARQGAAGRQ